MSFNKALETLLSETELERLEMGENKVFMGTNKRYVEARLETATFYGVYSRLTLTLFNDDHKSNVVRINLTDMKYAPPKNEWNNPDMPHNKGGYFWTSDTTFYNYTPRAHLVSAEVNRLLKFWEVGAFGV